MNGAAAMSVEMCEVTEISSADGTAASATQSSRIAPGRRRPRLIRGWRSHVGGARRRSISTPHHAISAISTTNSAAQAQRLLAKAS